MSHPPLNRESESMQTMESVCQWIATFAQPLDACELPLEQALYRVLAQPVLAGDDQPPYDRSAMDGFVVRLDDPGTEFCIVGEIRAGDWKPQELKAGEAMRISTGGALPCDGVQVVKKEMVTVNGNRLQILGREAVLHIRKRGEEARKGEELLKPGLVIRHGVAGLLASLGVVRPRVHRIPVVVHLATGNEIVPPGTTPKPGQIRDSNSTLVRTFFSEYNLVVRQHQVQENIMSVRADVEALANEADLLLISGGASVGNHDDTREFFESLGYDICVSKTSVRPGRPLILGRRGNCLAFGLPGNPLAHFVCLNIYVRAALSAYSGRDANPAIINAQLTQGEENRNGDWTTLAPGCLSIRNGHAVVAPLRWSSSGDLTALAECNALIKYEKGMNSLKTGDWVDCVSIGNGL